MPTKIDNRNEETAAWEQQLRQEWLDEQNRCLRAEGYDEINEEDV